MPSLLSPENVACTTYAGYIEAQGFIFMLRVANVRLAGSRCDDPAVFPFRSASLECCPRLAEAIRGSEDIVRERMNRSTSPKQLLFELQDILERVLRARPAPILPPAAFFSRVLDEIETSGPLIGWDKVLS